MPSVFAMSRQLVPESRSVARRTLSRTTWGRPRHLLAFRALSSPALVRSTIRARSCFAIPCGDRQHQLAGWTGGAEVSFGEALEFHAMPGQIADIGECLPDTLTGEAVKRRDHQYINAREASSNRRLKASRLPCLAVSWSMYSTVIVQPWRRQYSRSCSS